MTFADTLATVRMSRRKGDRSAAARAAIIALALLLVLSFFFSLASGASGASAWQVFLEAAGLRSGTLDLADRIVVFDIRMPRAVLGVLIGAALAVSGAIMQGVFRNPLADPGIVGVSAGAGLGAVAFIVLQGSILAPVAAFFGIYAIPFSAFLGGLASTLVLYRISTRHGHTSVATMLLAGIALGALSGAFTGLLVFWANDQQLRDLTFWGLGSLAGATWSKNFMVAPLILPVLFALPLMARGLNALALGEASARHLGTDVQRFKNAAIVCVASATGASVAVSGGIGFVGIVVPHLLRLAIGPDHRYLLPASALLGATLLLFADTIARQIVAPAELPIGIVTAAAGAPFFLWILLRKRGIIDL
ncbi:FecCD family ABC transporter permease [Oricola thermophila]|uniref:Iron ABC transporter permease n=1 Tax=Oricola thermophila TaxID=2742145 RepID=A0A6N1VLR6_9HYPH|nr:iron ABC transporter permease [Oricola thermophila]QKV20372.1 iron ABC transporter permease [Oricola thermophila]